MPTATFVEATRLHVQKVEHTEVSEEEAKKKTGNGQDLILHLKSEIACAFGQNCPRKEVNELIETRSEKGRKEKTESREI